MSMNSGPTEAGLRRNNGRRAFRLLRYGLISMAMADGNNTDPMRIAYRKIMIQCEFVVAVVVVASAQEDALSDLLNPTTPKIQKRWRSPRWEGHWAYQHICGTFCAVPSRQFLQSAVPRLSAFQLHCEGGYFGDVEARVPQGATFVEVLCALLLIQHRFLHR